MQGIRQFDTVKDKNGERFRVTEVRTDGAGHILAVLQGITTDNRTKRGRARLVSVPELEIEYKRIDLAPVEIIRRGRK